MMAWADYPRMMFHRTKAPVTIKSRDEEDALGAEWSRTIWPPEPEPEEPEEPDEEEPPQALSPGHFLAPPAPVEHHAKPRGRPPAPHHDKPKAARKK